MYRGCNYPFTLRDLPSANKEINMKQDSRKNSRRRERQKRRLALKKYMAEKKSKAGGSAKIEDENRHV